MGGIGPCTTSEIGIRMSFRHRAKRRVLRAARRGRQIAWAPEWMNLGNLLYLGLWAHEQPDGRHRRRVLLHPSRESAVGWFPELRAHRFIRPGEVSFFDQRLTPWRNSTEEPERFDSPLLQSYVQTMLLKGSGFAQRPKDLTDETMVVNVRRGDYFSVAKHQAEFGMNTVEYTLCAVERAIADAGLPGRIAVVSDDLTWCRDHLGGLMNFAAVDFREGEAHDDFAALIHAPRLVVPNSTFSYWGGYIGDVVSPGRQVVAPWLFSRNLNEGRAHQLRRSWTVIEEIPGGWAVTS